MVKQRSVIAVGRYSDAVSLRALSYTTSRAFASADVPSCRAHRSHITQLTASAHVPSPFGTHLLALIKIEMRNPVNHNARLIRATRFVGAPHPSSTLRLIPARICVRPQAHPGYLGRVWAVFYFGPSTSGSRYPAACGTAPDYVIRTSAPTIVRRGCSSVTPCVRTTVPGSFAQIECSTAPPPEPSTPPCNSNAAPARM
jgi:hypothetical protein